MATKKTPSLAVGRGEKLPVSKGGGVNAAGNYTKPEMRKRIFNSVKAAPTVTAGVPWTTA